MDQFVVKTPRSKEKPMKNKQMATKLKQATIHSLKDRDFKYPILNFEDQTAQCLVRSFCSLIRSTYCGNDSLQSRPPHKGVVVVEDILRLKSKLMLPNQQKSVIIESLKELRQKVPPRNVMLDTKIGHVVSKLKKHEDEDIVREAKRVYCMWRSFFEKKTQQPKIEVKMDAKSENMRLRGKTFLSDALKIERSDAIVEAIEREVFHQNKRHIHSAYQRTMRNIVFKLKASEDLRASVLSGNTSVEDFVKQHKKS